MNNPLSRVHLSHATFFLSVPRRRVVAAEKKSGIKILGVAGGVGHRKERERGAVGTKTMQHKNVPEIDNINDDFISKLSCFLLFAAIEYSTCKHRKTCETPSFLFAY